MVNLGMKARLVRIGNSRGVRIPKPLIEQAGLGEEVELRVEGGAVIIEMPRTVRADWADAAQQIRERGEDGLLVEPTATRFDEVEWEW